MLQFLWHFFMCLMELPVPTSLIDQSHLTLFYLGYDVLFYCRTALSMRVCNCILTAFSVKST